MSCRKKSYKDLDRFRVTRRNQKERYRDRTGAYLYGRRRWTPEEIELILAHDKTDREISLEIERSVNAIQVMRSRLNKQEEGGMKNED